MNLFVIRNVHFYNYFDIIQVHRIYNFKIVFLNFKKCSGNMRNIYLNISQSLFEYF